MNKRVKLQTRKTTIEQHIGDHHATGLPMVELRDIITAPSDYISDKEAAEDPEAAQKWLDDVHEARVELESLPCNKRDVAETLIDDRGDDLSDLAQNIRDAIASARGVGKPAKSANGAVAKVRSIRITDAEWAVITTKAKKAKLSVTDYIRKQALK